mmetsp:Transcript_36107/g.86078  ORF Transcript_36107/g.86078 Transcript_36107/m.86078 type:complete len:454 (-) Transcript_36107:6-1367(-)
MAGGHVRARANLLNTLFSVIRPRRERTVFMPLPKKKNRRGVSVLALLSAASLLILRGDRAAISKLEPSSSGEVTPVVLRDMMTAETASRGRNATSAAMAVEKYVDMPNRPAAADEGKVMYNSTYCMNEGSLHQLAKDMLHRSSPIGLEKLKHVLNSNRDFFIDSGKGSELGIFFMVERCIARMLEGYGLNQVKQTPPSSSANMTLVETFVTKSVCSILSPRCRDVSRIFIQSEQFFPKHVKLCHLSKNCIVIDFSEHNLRMAREENMDGSFVLLPVMTQTPSRLANDEPSRPKPLTNRSVDMVHFGFLTTRRKGLLRFADNYTRLHPGRVVMIEQIPSDSLETMSERYAESKVCVVYHSYATLAGGEYHRYSEFGPFGCIPVAETPSDKIGLPIFERCGGFAFVDAEQVIAKADDVLQMIDKSMYDLGYVQDIVRWWKKGVNWDLLLKDFDNK